ncbi:MAG: hypothetical protein ACR2FY_16350 [Pirellulaceae bacterium]
MSSVSNLPIGTLLVLGLLAVTAIWRYRSGKRQISLRGMLIGVFVVSLPLAWFSYGTREYMREQNAISKLRDAGIDVRTDNFHRPWQTFFFGSVWQHRAFAVYADAAPVTRHELELIGGLAYVSTIRIRQGDFADDDLASLAALPRLKELTLRHCPITGAGLRHIPAQVPMERLSLSFSPIDDAGLQNVAHWKLLEDLELSGTQITDAGLDSLAALENLDRLMIDHTAVTDAGIRRQEDLISHISTLSLRNTVVTQVTLDGLNKGYFWPPAPTTAHRQAATQLLLQGIEVNVRQDSGPSCNIAFGQNWKEHPQTADLLGQLCPIRSVRLRSPHPNDSVVPLLADMKDLTHIGMEGPALSPQGLRQLCRQTHPGLRMVEIEGCSFTAQTLSELAVFPSLEELYFNQMRIDEEGISAFAGFRRLRFLSFRNSRISDEGANNLHAVLPHTRVFHDGTEK